MPNIQSIRKLLVLSCSFFSILLWPMFADAVGQRKALLIGINDYALPAIPDLRGAVNDVNRLAEVLQTKMNFSPENVIKLTDQQATRDNILNELSAFINKVQRDDLVYIHFSGHGSQVKDLNGDEEDGYDETFLPYNARQKGIPDITDDEFERLFSQLSSDKVLIVFDSCHSGTVTRFIEPESGPKTEEEEFRSQLSPKMFTKDDRTELYEALLAIFDKKEKEDDGSAKTRAVVPVDTLEHVLMTAAPAEQEALDGPIGDNREFYGIFSFSLIKALEEHGPSGTPRQIHKSVKRTIADMQRRYSFQAPEPQLEISPKKLDQALF